MAGKREAALCPLDSAVLVRALRAEIPLFFYAAGISATKMLLFFRESAAMDILTIGGQRLRQALGQTCRNDTTDHIDGANRRERYDQAHRPAR